MAKAISPQIQVGGSGFSLPKSKTYMYVDFTREQINSMLQSTHPLSTVVGLMFRPAKIDAFDKTLDVVRIEKSAIAADGLPDLGKISKSTVLTKKIGTPKKINVLPAPFLGLLEFGFVYFEVEVIKKMLNYKSTTQGLRLTLVKIEMLDLPMHQSLAMAPYPISDVNPVSDGTAIVALAFTEPTQDFITYSIGYGCPPVWPPNFELVNSTG